MTRTLNDPGRLYTSNTDFSGLDTSDGKDYYLSIYEYNHDLIRRISKD